MKTIFIILFLFIITVITGCNPVYNYSSKEVTVYKTTVHEKDYAVLSVRGDSEIVVLDWVEAKVTPIPFSHAEVIKDSSIVKITRAGRGSSTKNMLAGTAYGAAIGGFCGLLLPFVFLLQPTPDATPNYSNLIPAFIVSSAACAFTGALIGTAIGAAIPDSKELHLTSGPDRDFLRSISAYPDREPDEMRYLK